MVAEDNAQSGGSSAESTGDPTGDPTGDSAVESGGALNADLFVERLAPAVRASLSPDQLQEIRRVATVVAPRDHALDWRVSLPSWFGGRRFYGVVLAGADHRGPQRRAQDRMVRRQRRRSAVSALQVIVVAIALLALILMVAVGVVHAQEAESGLLGIEGADDRTPIETDKWPWRALGRINREIGGHCTGALIAPDLVLTAAHCLYNFSDGRWAIPMEVHFVAGYRRGEFKEHAVGKSFHIAPNWDPRHAKDKSNIGSDWALIKLGRRLDTRPVEISTLSFPEMMQAAAEGELTIAGYNGDFAEILTQHSGCDLLSKAEAGRLLIHDCDVTFGSSGAPLLLITRDDAQIIGLQSAIVQLEDGREVGAAVSVDAFRKAAADN